MIPPGAWRWLTVLSLVLLGGWIFAVKINHRSPVTEPKRLSSAAAATGSERQLTTPYSPLPAAGGIVPIERLTPVPESTSAVSSPSLLTDEELNEWLRQAGLDPAGTLGKALEIQDGAVRREILEWVLTAWSSENREPALEWLKESLPHMAEDDVSHTLAIVIGSWAREEPIPSMAWVEANLTGTSRHMALVGVAENWAESDMESMATWVAEQNDPPDFWAGELVQALVATDPVRALEYCDTLTDGEIAEGARQTVIQSWLLTAPNDARAYLRSRPELVPETEPEEYTPAR